MQKVEILCGAPASGKSTYCKYLMAAEPGKWKRINNDSLRESFDFSYFSPQNEKIISDLRKHLLEKFLHLGYSVLIDNVNANKRNFKDVTSIVENVNRDVLVYEKPFYCELAELLARNSKREGVARVPDKVVEKFFKDLGGVQFKFYNPRTAEFYKNSKDKFILLKQDENLPKGIIVDLDGTLAIIGDRSPYSAANCDVVDSPNDYVVETVKLYHNAGYKIIFCSGRMEKDRAPTIRFIEACLPAIPYELHMRPDNDTRKDFVIKEEIFNNKIKNNYNIKLVIDDRLSVCRMWHSIGLNLLRAGNPDASF